MPLLLYVSLRFDLTVLVVGENAFKMKQMVMCLDNFFSSSLDTRQCLGTERMFFVAWEIHGGGEVDMFEKGW